MGSIVRPYQPITQSVNGVPINCYPSKTTLQVDLYTKGYSLNDETGVTAVYENTAVNDLTDFVNFINSTYVDDWSGEKDVSILANQVHDLTGLINDTSWEYRAMAELEIGFTQGAVGHTGTMFDDGIPYHDNGVPKYDSEGYAIDRNWVRLTDDHGQPLPPLPIGPDGKPVYPDVEITPSGGRTQELASQHTGWFNKIENPELVKEELSNGKQS